MEWSKEDGESLVDPTFHKLTVATWKLMVGRWNLGGGFKAFFMFNPTWGNDPNLTDIFQVGWNHQQEIYFQGYTSVSGWVTYPNCLISSHTHLCQWHTVGSNCFYQICKKPIYTCTSWSFRFHVLRDALVSVSFFVMVLLFHFKWNRIFQKVWSCFSPSNTTKFPNLFNLASYLTPTS